MRALLSVLIGAVHSSVVGASAPVVDLASAQGTAKYVCTPHCNIGEDCVPDNGGLKCIDDGGFSGANGFDFNAESEAWVDMGDEENMGR